MCVCVCVLARNEDFSALACPGMGELHLDIYVERMKREYNVEVTVGEPKVNYRETITQRADFNYLHKKQTGGAGQFARIVGFVEPLPEDSKVCAGFSMIASTPGCSRGLRLVLLCMSSTEPVSLLSPAVCAPGDICV